MKQKVLVGDFETTVYEGQTYTEVWASAIVPLYSEDVVILGSINSTYEYLCNLKQNVLIYYHNLKFDGSFWMDYLMRAMHYKQAWSKQTGWLKNNKMLPETFKYSISTMGSWYTITIKTKSGYIIEIRDSYKLLPYSVKAIGKGFKTKHQKLDMEYEGYRYANCHITEEEKHYIRNDVLVVKEAIEYMYANGHDKLTIGSCCMAEFKRSMELLPSSNPKTFEEYDLHFPNVYEMSLDREIYGTDSVGKYVSRAYRGAWCYGAKGKLNRLKYNGVTLDVNSLYPSMMHSCSGNRYPHGAPKFWKGNYIPDVALQDDKYYFLRIRTRFYIKKGYLPFIQVKKNSLYRGNECLTTSDVYYNGKYHKFLEGFDGERIPTSVEMTITMTDLAMIQRHYNLVEFEILDGCYFNAKVGMFDKYIDHYMEQKMNSEGCAREEAKLFLNNLYGKFASKPDSSYKRSVMENDKIRFEIEFEEEKIPGYMPVGAAITSYARAFTITAAQANYYGDNMVGFIYADTDSIHCDLPIKAIRGVEIDDRRMCCWKVEGLWDFAIFVRQKTYIEHIISSEEPYYDVKCAGMPKECKDLFIRSVTQEKYQLTESEKMKLSGEELLFLQKRRDIRDFRIGLKIPGAKKPRRIKGGILLVKGTYVMRPRTRIF